jgi:hypothetical protein
MEGEENAAREDNPASDAWRLWQDVKAKSPLVSTRL